MLVANAGAEMDVAPHFSVALPLYWSGWNYFSSDCMLRMFAVMPEGRYWLKAENKGWFATAHLGLAYYDYAKGGSKRYQDHDGNTPAYGGGIAVGYRMPLRHSSKWLLEFSAGYGIYHLDYDIYENRHNGLLIGRKKRTFYGIDNVGVSLCYRFDMNRKSKMKK